MAGFASRVIGLDMRTPQLVEADVCVTDAVIRFVDCGAEVNKD
jgi:hypothetical protein